MPAYDILIKRRNASDTAFEEIAVPAGKLTEFFTESAKLADEWLKREEELHATSEKTKLVKPTRQPNETEAAFRLRIVEWQNQQQPLEPGQLLAGRKPDGTPVYTKAQLNKDGTLVRFDGESDPEYRARVQAYRNSPAARELVQNPVYSPTPATATVPARDLPPVGLASSASLRPADVPGQKTEKDTTGKIQKG